MATKEPHLPPFCLWQPVHVCRQQAWGPFNPVCVEIRSPLSLGINFILMLQKKGKSVPPSISETTTALLLSNALNSAALFAGCKSWSLPQAELSAAADAKRLQWRKHPQLPERHGEGMFSPWRSKTKPKRTGPACLEEKFVGKFSLGGNLRNQQERKDQWITGNSNCLL